MELDYLTYTDPYVGYTVGLALAGVSGGRCKMAYYLDDPNGKRIFEGDDFSPSPMYACDGPESAASLLSFLTLQPGDTDKEYFAEYTAEQLDWTDTADCEHLSLWADLVELEEQDWHPNG